MGRGVNRDHPVLDVFIEQWPSLIFLPASSASLSCSSP